MSFPRYQPAMHDEGALPFLLISQPAALFTPSWKALSYSLTGGHATQANEYQNSNCAFKKRYGSFF